MLSLGFHCSESSCWSLSLECVFFLFVFGHAAWLAGILVPDQGFNLGPWQRKHRVVTTGSLGNSHNLFFSGCFFFLFLFNSLSVLFAVSL